MAIATGHRFKNHMVDLERGQISREIFVSEEIYQIELEQVFARSWLFLGHESQIPKVGDYFVSGMGEESVILCRDREGQIHAFLNSCRHRGMKVCRYDEGNTPVFTCPYHGWSYATDGRLAGVPFYKDAYHGKLDKSKWGLVEVAQIFNYIRASASLAKISATAPARSSPWIRKATLGPTSLIPAFWAAARKVSLSSGTKSS